MFSQSWLGQDDLICQKWKQPIKGKMYIGHICLGFIFEVVFNQAERMNKMNWL